MTAQIGENLYYDGETHYMTTNPLGAYFSSAGIEPGFEYTCSTLWCGYIGTWEIVENRLYLLELDGTLKGGEEASVATFFPDFSDRVFANWYTGAIRISQGKLLKYVHRGYSSTYERDLTLEIEKGVIVATKVCHNGTGDDNAPEGYGVRAFTTFPPDKSTNSMI